MGCKINRLVSFADLGHDPVRFRHKIYGEEITECSKCHCWDGSEM